MTKIFVVLLVIINIFVLLGLSGLVFYQFKQILDRDNQISVLSSKVANTKTSKSNIKSDSSTAVTQSSLQIKDNDGQLKLFNALKKNTEGKASIKIFLLKGVQDSKNTSTTYALERLTDRQDILYFALEQLVKGPTSIESDQGFISPIELSGISNCGGGDFNLLLLDGIFTVKMCKLLSSKAGSNSEDIQNLIESTAKQFSEIKKVIILNSNNTCFGDSSGQDLCKNI